MGMFTLLRMAVLAALIVIAQGSLAADRSAEPTRDEKPLANEAQLKRMIHETIMPKPLEHRPLPDDVRALLNWSAPVNGLVARTEYIALLDFCVRLKNVSQWPLKVPTANRADAAAPRFFEVYVKQGHGSWGPITGPSRFTRYFADPPDLEKGSDRLFSRSFQRQQVPVDRPGVTLQPGEDCIALVAGRETDGNGEPRMVKVVLSRSKSGDPQQWAGVLETPSRPLESEWLVPPERRESLPFPTHFPDLCYDFSPHVAMSGRESPQWYLCHNNLLLTNLASLYEPAAVRREFELRMQRAKSLPMKLELAIVAAPAGSEAAALLLMRTMRSSDYGTWSNLHDAFTSLSFEFGEPGSSPLRRRDPPPWLEELFLATSSDNRPVTGLGKTAFEKETPFTISSEFGMLPTLVGWKYAKAIPLLKERVKSGKADYHTWSDLAELGDEPAVHQLIELLDQIGTKGPLTSEETLDDNFSQIAMTFGGLKAREAVPVLLRYVEYPEIITCLEQIGDERATPALKKIVQDNGRILRDGLAVHPKFEQERLFAARLALAQFDPANAPLRLGELLADPDRFRRSNVLDRLENLTDPRTIPFLVNVFKTDTDHWILRRSVRDLGRRKYKAAVEGLIACFDRKFKEEYFGKGEHVTPQTYPNLIAHSLQQITGKTFGADKQAWQKWWQEEGRLRADLK
jgi:HEAT repeat protein